MASGTCSCGFDLGRLPAKHRVKPEDGGDLNLSCPLCGLQLKVSLQTLGILVRGKGAQTEYLRWKVSSNQAAGPHVALGAFQVRFDTLKTIEPRDICYAKVPVFVDENGENRVPDLPVRPAFFDCVDQEAFAKLLANGANADLVGGEYHIRLPLNGLLEAVAVRLPVLTHKSSVGREERAFRDINLRVWPNVPIADWKYYLVGISGTGEGAAALMGDGRTRLRIRARSSSDRGWSPPLASVQRAGLSISGAATERPRWLSLEVFDGDAPPDTLAEAGSGGLFFVPVVAKTKKAQGEIHMGLDFGTSNTCVAFTSELVPEAPQGSPQLIPEIDETRWSQYLIRGGREPSIQTGPDLWPSPRGFGPKADLFASELMFPRTKADQMSVLDVISDWRFGIDFGLANAGAQPQFLEADFMLSDFKWSEMLRTAAPTYAMRIVDLQAHYIAAVLMTSYLRVAIGHSVEPGSVERVLCSFPMSFSDDDVAILTEALEAARRLLEARTGLSWRLALGADESTAAAANAGTLSEAIHVYLDMGGGSTDIAVKFKPGDKVSETVYLGSVRYAGMALLHAFEGEGKNSTCLASNTSVDVLRRRVREARSVKELLSDPSLFSKHQEGVRRNRVLHFYGYVVELAARMIAAGFLDQRFMVKAEDGTVSFPPELPIAVFFLGNGWRFQGSVADDFEASLSTDMWKRTVELLREEKSPYAAAVMKALKGVKLSQKAKKLERIHHEKAAVAVGLLTNARADDRRPKPSSIVGWTTKVDSKREIPWFAMYRAGATEKPPRLHSNPHKDDASSTIVVFGDEEPSGPSTGLEAPWYDEDLPANPTLDWRDTNPKIPTVFESPFELDEDLNHTRGELRRQCHYPKQKWFAKGPYEVLLEELFKRKLRTIGA